MRVHFIGIGGIGVSALAQYYFKKGAVVSGSDLTSSEITNKLKRNGIKIFIGRHKEQNLSKDIDLAVYSSAVPPNNLEIRKAKKLGVKIQSYPEALGDLTRKYFTIAVSGTHGKSTTTAMISLILIKAGFDPNVVVGTKLKEFTNTNFRKGGNKYLVIEADEWQASFLNYWPKIIVLTNIEREHLDYYKNLNHILKTFREYIGRLPKDGVLVANGEDKNITKLLNCQTAKLFKVKRYSLKQKETRVIKKILKIPGEHNVSNALAALTVARVLSIPDKISFKVLSEYKGAWRRFEISECKIKKSKNYKLISDYGHHPTEIKATLKAARQKFPKRKIWCVFQPHQYQRTFYLFDDFVMVFRSAPADKLIITDIYDVVGREQKDIKKRVNSKKLVEKIKQKALKEKEILYIPKNKIKNYLLKNLRGGEVLIIMGAGDIYKLAESFSIMRQK